MIRNEFLRKFVIRHDVSQFQVRRYKLTENIAK